MPALRERYAAADPRFELMRELALVLNQKRIQRGAIDFDMPEPLIEFDEFGEMTGVSAQPAQHRAPADRRVHAVGERSRGVAPGAGRHPVDLPHSREARSEARDGIRRDRHAFRLFARASARCR